MYILYILWKKTDFIQGYISTMSLAEGKQLFSGKLYVHMILAF